MKVAIYCRVSRIDQNPENQKIELERFAKSMGYDYEIFEEQESTRKTRPIKDKIFREALMRKYDMILVWKLDRWARSLQELVNDLNMLKQNKVQFIALKGNVKLDDSPINNLLIHILGSFAEFERDIIRERTIAGLERARAQGKKLGRPRTSNYQRKKVLELYKELKSMNAVAKQMQIGYGTVYNIIKKAGVNDASQKD